MASHTEERESQTMETPKAALLAEAQAVLDEIEPLVEALFACPANRNLPPSLVIAVAVMVYRERQRLETFERLEAAAMEGLIAGENLL